MALSILGWLSLASAIGEIFVLKALQICVFFWRFFWYMQFLRFFQGIFLSISFFKGRSLGNPIVTDVQPRRIGYGGGAVTIHGQVNIFTSFQWKIDSFYSGIFWRCFQPVWPGTWKQGMHQQALFNCLYSEIQVWFANEFVSVVCKTPISSNFLLENPQDPSTTRITCHLPARMGSQGSNWFNLILKVNATFIHPSSTWHVL